MSFNLTVGADPEIFLIDRVTGLNVSAHDLLPGTKTEPFKVAHGAVQVDGMAAEFNINPAKNFKQFNENIVHVLGDIQNIAPTVFFDKRSAIIFSDEVLASVPEEAKVLGCDPDYNAYTMEANPRPVPSTPGLRTAAGHIHIGLGQFDDWRSPEHFKMMAELCRALDCFVGTASVLMDHNPIRRSLYGAAGAMRVKPYGMEYRVPSNGWIFDRSDREIMYDLVCATIEYMMSGADLTRDFAFEAEVRRAIDTSDVSACSYILENMREGGK